jgi:hypothetical protein
LPTGSAKRALRLHDVLKFAFGMVCVAKVCHSGRPVAVLLRERGAPKYWEAESAILTEGGREGGAEHHAS